MSSNSNSPGKTSRLVAGRYPPPGADPVADRISARRGARGLTPLDANLLHFPAMAGGYNDLIAALRTGGQLPGDVRELMILRIAALNAAAFEWIQHEPVGRAEGLTTGQLYIIRDTVTPLPPMPGMLSPLQSIALQFTDAVTCGLNFTIDLGHMYKVELVKWIGGNEKSLPADDLKSKVEDLYVEASMIVAGYNMVSRFLVTTDVNGLTGAEVPWPLERHEHNIQVPSYSSDPTRESITHPINTVVLKQHASVNLPPKWLVFANSLLTDWRIWGWIIPYFLDGGLSYDIDGKDIRKSTSRQTYNIVLHSQRGHGKSGLPSPLPGDSDSRQTTIPLLGQDIQNLLIHPDIRVIIDGSTNAAVLHPIHSIIGVSQGGAAALAFAALSPASSRQAARPARSIIACDTSAKTPGGNKAAWAERVQLVYGGGGGTSDNTKDRECPANGGMRTLSKVTVPRWFPAGSPLSSERDVFVKNMVSSTDVQAFVAGAEALGEYDLTAGPHPLYESVTEHILLLAGSLDGGGKVGQGLQQLKKDWTTAAQGHAGGAPMIEYAEISGSGHLPIIDQPERFCEVVGSWLAAF